MKIRRAAAGASIAALLPFAGMALAQNAPAGDSNAELRREIEDQKQRLLVLERKLEIQQEAATAAAATAPRITASASRFQIGSTDNSNFVRLRGTLHADAAPTAATRFRKSPTPSSCGACARPSKAPSAASTTSSSCRTSPAAASVIVDAYVAARFNPGCRRDGRQVQAARRTRAPAKLGRHPLHRTRAARPSWCRTAISACSSRAISPAAPSPTRSATSTASPTARAATTSRRPTSKWTRPATTPRACSSSRSSTPSNFSLRGLGFGVGTTWIDVDGTAANTALSAYRSPGQQSVFAYRANTATGVTPNNATFADGERLRLAPQFYYYRGSFGLLGEYTQVEAGRVARRRRRHASPTR